MDLGLTGKHIIITGASGGVGVVTAQKFLESGANVTLHYNTNSSTLSPLVSRFPLKTYSHSADVTSESAVQNLVTSAVENFGPVHVLVVCHGIWPDQDIAIKDMEYSRWKATLEVNLDGTFLFVKHFLQQLDDYQRKNGSLLENIAIVLLVQRLVNSEKLSILSAMIYGMTLSLKNEIVKVNPNARVNTVSPGWIRTPMAERAMQDESLLYQALATSPLKKVSEPTDIANAILFLASAKVSGNITGVTLDVNSGMEGRLIHQPRDFGL
ncbi:NAD dependent epimerase/dehydratase [Paraphysoderma sedebokerense]|nr:NAD dependent epimerase/dehydratase [Paraphysoderma sedebokerense]